MPTITASPGLVYQATQNWASTTIPITSGGQVTTILFKNSLGSTLIGVNLQAGSPGMRGFMAANGYYVLSAWSAFTPSATGTIDYIEITSTGASPTLSNALMITLVVGAIGSGADVEIDNRDVISGFPWQLQGSIRFRVPNSITYSL